jgi:hypothetical protein
VCWVAGVAAVRGRLHPFLSPGHGQVLWGAPAWGGGQVHFQAPRGAPPTKGDPFADEDGDVGDGDDFVEVVANGGLPGVVAKRPVTVRIINQ